MIYRVLIFVSIYQCLLYLISQNPSYGQVQDITKVEAISDSSNNELQLAHDTTQYIFSIDMQQLPEKYYQEKKSGDDNFNHFDNYAQFIHFANKIIDMAEKSGYPYASLKLDSIHIINDTISASVAFSEGPLITFDSLIIEGDIKLKNRFLQDYFNIRSGELYSKDAIDRIPPRSMHLGLFELTADPQTIITDGKAKVVLYVKPKPANQVDGILGMAATPNEEKSYQLTGMLDLELKNLFSSAKYFGMNWKRLRPRSQTLDVRYKHPFLFYTPLHLHAGLNIYKEDTLYFNRDINLSVATTIKDKGEFSALFQSRMGSTLGSSDPVNVGQAANFKLNSYGLAYALNLEDEYVYRKGFGGSISGLFGNKNITSVGDTAVQKKLTQYTLSGSVFGCFNHNRIGVKARLSAAMLISDELFLNDYFRLGGMRSLRGFREDFFYTETYSVAQFDYFLLANSGLELFLLSDFGLLYRDKEQELPLGLGFGLNIGFNNGHFQLIFGVGKSRQQDFAFEKSILHFGYKASF